MIHYKVKLSNWHLKARCLKKDDEVEVIDLGNDVCLVHSIFFNKPVRVSKIDLEIHCEKVAKNP
jgi:hypothetical protein